MSNKPFSSKQLINDEKLLEKMLNHFKSINWESDTYIIHGNYVTPKRKTFMYGIKYSYSGITKKPLPFDEKIKWIANQIEKTLGLEKNFFNGVLCNLYQDGDTHISYHTDDEKSLDKTAPIVSLCLGATRKFYLKDIETGVVTKLTHKNGEIITMFPPCQTKYKHSIPKEKKVKDVRISLTFRKFNNQ